MAYAYPEAGAVVTPTRKTSEDFDVLREFKRKISEDEAYVNYFNERIRIEQIYIDGLTRLHSKTVAIDSLHDDVNHRPRPSARQAWVEVRDYTQREIDSREALVNALKEDVVVRLVALKETQGKIRQRIREDLKSATDAYDDYAFSKVPKLKRNYWSKCQTLEDHKRQEHAIAMQAKLLSESSPTASPSHEKPHPFSLAPPTVSAPQPPMSNPAMSIGGSSGGSDTPPLSVNFSTTTMATATNVPSGALSAEPRKSGGSALIGRARASSGSGINLGVVDVKSKEVLSDIAAQGKKGFTAIMQRLGGDKGEREDLGESPVTSSGGSVETGLQRRGTAGGGVKPGGAIKGVKVKRDADDADRAYRLGVFHLESLRLRRERLKQSAITSLQQFNDDLNATLLDTLRAFTDATHGTAATLAQATEVVSAALNEVNLETDTMLFRSKIPASQTQRTAPVLYENFYVGLCRSLIFGISLTDYDFARGEGGNHGFPPQIVEKCISWLDARGLETEGIYRISGRQAMVKKMIQDIERNEDSFQLTPNDDVFSVSAILKQYLRELPEPLFPLPHIERVKYTENRESHIHSNFSALRTKLRRLPPIHQTTFQAVIEHLGRVQAHSKTNKMDAKNLAVVFNSVVFGHDQVPADGNVLTMHLEKDTVLEDLVTYSDLLFRTPSPALAPGTMPPGAALSRSGVLTYHAPDDGPQPGSSHTRVEIVNLNDDGDEIVDGEAGATLKSSAVVTGDSESSSEAVVTPPTMLTADALLHLLFDATKIPATLRDGIGSDLHVRPLASDDFLRSHFGLLSTLSTSPALAPSVYKSHFNALKACADTYYVVVIIERATDQIVASATLIAERKFIHAAGVAGHIEDVVVSPTMQGKGLGIKLVQGLREMATALGCYKTILDCQENKIEFYEKCGFSRRGTQMAFYVSTIDLWSTQARDKSASGDNTAAAAESTSLVEAQHAGTDVGNVHAVESPVEAAEESHEGHVHDDETSSIRSFESDSSGSSVTYHFPTKLGGEAALSAEPEPERAD